MNKLLMKIYFPKTLSLIDELRNNPVLKHFNAHISLVLLVDLFELKNTLAIFVKCQDCRIDFIVVYTLEQFFIIQYRYKQTVLVITENI